MAARMVDISNKENVPRTACARGLIRLRRQTIEALRARRIKKGDVIGAAQVAGILAAKRAFEIIPFCHPIPIAQVQVRLEVKDDSVMAECTVSAQYSTGVEMEALTGASVALLTVWDMVKYLEKDEQGQYPQTAITDIRVVFKSKG